MMKLRLSKSWNMIKIQSIINKHLNQLNDLKRIKDNKNLPKLQFLAFKLLTSLKSKQKMSYLKLKLFNMKPKNDPSSAALDTEDKSSFLNLFKMELSDMQCITPQNEFYQPPGSLGAHRAKNSNVLVPEFQLDTHGMDNSGLITHQSNMILHFTSVGSEEKRLGRAQFDATIVVKMQRRACRIFNRILVREILFSKKAAFDQLFYTTESAESSLQPLELLDQFRKGQNQSLYVGTKKSKNLFLDSFEEKRSIKELCGTFAYLKMKERSSQNQNYHSRKNSGLKFFISPKKELKDFSAAREVRIDHIQIDSKLNKALKKDTLLSIKAKHFVEGLTILTQFENKMKSLGFM